MSRGRVIGATRPHANQWGSACPLRVPKGDDIGRVVELDWVGLGSLLPRSPTSSAARVSFA